MKIIIHGTYGGYKILTPEHTVIVNDVRSESANYCAGVSFYSIAYNGIVVEYTKFVCVRDLNRSNAAGNIAITLSCQDGERISGNDALDILDELTNEFCQKFVHNSYFDVIPKSWDFIDKYQQKSVYKTKINQSLKHADAKICAFCYYSDRAELIRLMDYPDKANYTSYKQVFLVDKSLKGSVNNPVSNYLGRIDNDADLTNRYLLKYTESDIRIIVTQNGKIRENYTEIPMDGEITIEYSKEYHKKETITIDLNNITSHAQYIIVDDSQQTVVINSIKLEPEVKPVEIIVVNEQHIKVPGESMIECTNDLKVKKYPKLDGSIIEFVGEEIGKSWVVSATSFDKKESGRHILVPGKLLKPQFELMVSEPKPVRLEAYCSEANILSDTEFVAHCPNFAVKNPNSHKELVFYGAEKYATWEVEATSRNCVAKKLQFVPKNQESLGFELKKTFHKADGGDNGFNNTKKPFPVKLVAIIVTLLVVLSVAIFLIVANVNKKKEKLIAEAGAMSETIGNLLYNNKIDGKALEEQNKKLNDNPKLVEYDKTLKNYKDKKEIENVLEVYEFIRGQRNFVDKIPDDKVTRHECFAKKLNSIKTDDRREVIEYMNEQFRNIEVIDVDEVCDFLDAYKELSEIKDKADDVNKRGKEMTSAEKKKMKKDVDKIIINKWKSLASYKNDVISTIDNIKEKEAPKPQKTTAFDKRDEIIAYLNGGELKKSDVQTYKGLIDKYNRGNNNKERDLADLVDLYLDLWERSNIEIEDYEVLVEKIKQNDLLQENSPLKIYLKSKRLENIQGQFKQENIKIGQK